MKIKNFLTIIGLMSLIASGIPNLGMATTITTTDNGGAYGGYSDSGNITPSPNGSTSSADVYFGGDSQTLNTINGVATGNLNFATVGGNFLTWCVDIYHWDTTKSTYTVETAAQLASEPGFSTNKVSALIQLANEDYSLVNNQNKSAAFQLAVWAIMFGTPNSSGIYQVDSSTFKASDGNTSSTGPIAIANDWLDALSNDNYTGNYQLTYLSDGTGSSDGNTQDMVVFTSVPEPGTILLLGFGLMGIGLARSRKNRKP